MELRVGKNHLGNDLYDLYDDNGKFVMEQCVVEGKVNGKNFNGQVVATGHKVFKIRNGTVNQVIEYEDVQQLTRLDNWLTQH